MSRGCSVAGGAQREEAGGCKSPSSPSASPGTTQGCLAPGEVRDAVTWSLSSSPPAGPRALGWTRWPVAPRWPREGGMCLSASRSARALVISATSCHP